MLKFKTGSETVLITAVGGQPLVITQHKDSKTAAVQFNGETFEATESLRVLSKQLGDTSAD